MSKLFLYPKLAFINLKKQAKLYVPYILASILTIMMFYILFSMSINSEFTARIRGVVMALGSIVIGAFSIIFVFYINSFLMKRRKRELGLYNILGMEKKHIAGILSFESLFIGGLSILFGIGFGFVFSKLVFLVFQNLTNMSISYGFEFSSSAAFTTVVFFTLVYGAAYLYNLTQVHLANPIELLRGSEVGEKEPKTKMLSAILGTLCLVVGYALALSVKSPMEAVMLFFIAVILVIVGTYLVFAAGSIAFLKLLRKNTKYYYQTSHFISVSSMLYRMKQNAVGLANICILSTMVLVMISSTSSLQAGAQDNFNRMYPDDVIFTLNDTQIGDLETRIENIQKVVKDFEIVNYKSYRKMDLFGTITDQQFHIANDNSVMNFEILSVMAVDEYNRNYGTDYVLTEDEILVWGNRSNHDFNQLSIGSLHFKVKEILTEFESTGDYAEYVNNNPYMLVQNTQVMNEVLNQFSDSSDRYQISFDLVNKQDKDAMHEAISTSLVENGSMYYSIRDDMLEREYYELTGGFFFLGVFLSVLFLVVMALIMYYKQISEGYEDQRRYDILMKVGMSHQEIKKTISSQIILVFFLPLFTAGLHFLMAFHEINYLLSIFNMYNTALFVLCSVICFLIFTIFYILVYKFTAKVYYKIVS